MRAESLRDTFPTRFESRLDVVMTCDRKDELQKHIQREPSFVEIDVGIDLSPDFATEMIADGVYFCYALALFLSLHSILRM